MEALSFSFAITKDVSDLWKTKKKALDHSYNSRLSFLFLLIKRLVPSLINIFSCLKNAKTEHSASGGFV